MELVGRTETEDTPTARDVTTAVAMVDKLSLEHKRAGLATLETLSAEAKQLLDTIRDVTPDESDDVLLQIAEDELS